MNSARGNCVAISEKLALCALHSGGNVGTNVTVTTDGGKKLKAKIVFNRYESGVVDISVLELEKDFKFENFIATHHTPLGLLEKIYVFGRKLENDRPENFSAGGEVNCVVENCSIVQSNYPGCKGLSGAPVVTVIENNELRVVGVHVGVHGESADLTAGSDDDELNEPATRADVSDAISTLSHASHGLSTYAMICDLARVRPLMTFLKKRCSASTSSNATKATGTKRKRN